MAKGIQSIVLGFKLLRGVADADQPVSLKHIAAVAGMSPSKARMYLISFIETGIIIQKPETGFYGLGPYALNLGMRALQRMELMSVAGEAMRTLQQQTESLVLLTSWDMRGVMIVARAESNRPQPLQFPIGGSASLGSTATGHVFLAFGPREQMWNHLAEELEEFGLTKAEQRKRTQVLKALTGEIRERGIADTDPIVYASGVTLSGYAALAAPILDAARQLRYVLTLIYPTRRPHKKKDELIRLTLECANRASQLAGALPAP